MSNVMFALLVALSRRLRLVGALWCTVPLLSVSLTKAFVFVYTISLDYFFASWCALLGALSLALFFFIVRDVPAGDARQSLLTGRGRAQTHVYSSTSSAARTAVNAGGYTSVVAAADYDGFESAEEYSDDSASESESRQSRATSFGSANEPAHQYKLVERIVPISFSCPLKTQPGDELLLADLRERFAGLSDATLFRFLVARDRNVENAARMIREHLAFRAQYDLDNIYFGYSPTAIRCEQRGEYEWDGVEW